MSATAIASVKADVTTVVNTESTTGFGKYHFCIVYHIQLDIYLIHF